MKTLTKKIQSLIKVSAICGAMLSLSSMAEVTVGSTAPDFELVDATGKAHKLSDHKGKIVVLEWLNHGCPFVKKHYDAGNMQKLQADAAAQGVIWLSVISSAKGKQGYAVGAELAKLNREKKSAALAVLVDESGKVGRAYGAKVTPHMYIIGKDGKVAYNGAIDDKPTTKTEDVATATPLFANALSAVQAVKPVVKATNQPYGCSVKYE